MKQIGIIGAGAWGTALALAIARSGKKVLLYAREPEVVEEINEKKENGLYLKHIRIENGIIATNKLQEVADSDILLSVAPAQFTRGTCRELKPFYKKGTPFVLCSKGMEKGTGALLSEVAREEIPDAEIAVLSGPAFAAEVALKLPTAVTISATQIEKAMMLSYALGSKYFRPYASDDIISAQVGGALKNVIAIAAGIAEGARLGDNARAVIVTRGLHEMSRLAVALGGKEKTLDGLSGLGDLVLSATSQQSRNFSIGRLLGEADGSQEILSLNEKTVEGAYTVCAVLDRAKAAGVEMPICQGVYEILYKKTPIRTVLECLVSRPFKAED